MERNSYTPLKSTSEGSGKPYNRGLDYLFMSSSPCSFEIIRVLYRFVT